MGVRLKHLILSSALLILCEPLGEAGKYGFADKEGGGKNDPVIEVSASIGPNAGAVFSLTEKEANQLYTYNSTTGNFDLATPIPTIPQLANGANQFIRLEFPMSIAKKKIRQSLAKNTAALSATSFLMPNILIQDETGAHVAGIAVIDGKTVDGTSVKSNPDFPRWDDAQGKNRLIGKDVFTYVSDLGDQDLSSIAAFGGTIGTPETSAIKEVRVRLAAVGGVIVNGYWVLKIGDGTGAPVDAGALTIASLSAKSPVTPQKYVHGNLVVDAFSSFVVEYNEPVVPESVGFSAEQVKKFNAGNPLLPMVYNGNSAMVPNPENLQVPFYPNFRITATANGVSTFTVPFDVRPVNPNNLSQYVINPLIDMPGKLDMTLKGLAYNTNTGWTSLPPVGTIFIASAATSFYNVAFNDETAAASEAYHLLGSRAFTNVPVAPQALYYGTLTGSGIGAINLDGNGFETNAPDVEKLVILTNYVTDLSDPFGVALLGGNPSRFGDRTGTNVIGIAGNPPEMGGPTPVPGVNEGSWGTLANQGNPYAVYPPGFETVARNSEGDPRLASAPTIGAVGDIQVGDFLDKLFYDTLNGYASIGLHTALSLGGIPIVGSYPSNNISDPPYPNPPPMRLPVGLPPVDIIFSQQKLKKPAFLIEGDEVFSNLIPPTNPPPAPYLMYCAHSWSRVLFVPNPYNPLAVDLYPTFSQNGPWYQSFPWPTLPLVPTACYPGIPYSARQQIGNFLYVTDRDNGVVHCLNSNNFSVVDTIQTSDPEGLGISPDLKSLWVSNFGADTVSLVGVDPWAPNFHKEVTTIKVGAGPRDVAVQPDGEDIFVSNFLGNSVSIIDPTSQTVRKTLQNAIKKPWQVCLSQRHTSTGWIAAVYFGFIGNQGTGDVLIYESGPTGSTGVGLDDIRWKVELLDPLSDLRHMRYDPLTHPGHPTGVFYNGYAPAVGSLPGGVYVTHRDADTGLAMISRACWTAQLPSAGAFPPTPMPSAVISAPGVFSRKFEVVGSWGGPLVPINQKINYGGQDQVPYGIALNDFNAWNFFSYNASGVKTNVGGWNSPASVGAGGINSKHPTRGGGPTWAPDRLYVSFPGDNRIEVLEANLSGVRVNTIEGVPTPGVLASYFDQ
ncbi:MAG: YncE family protein [Planctomycetes bacterium]|nr:YncE family protein [Planctomycetota bacterium]